MSGSRAFCDLQTKTISGTSMATPAVAGAAAVFLSEFPNKTPKEAKAYLKCSAIDGTISDVKGTPNKFLHVSTSVKQSCLSGGGGGGGGGSGGGSPPAATPAPVPVPATPAPVPAPPGACQDKSPSGFTLNGAAAQCSDLKNYCRARPCTKWNACCAVRWMPASWPCSQSQHALSC